MQGITQLCLKRVVDKPLGGPPLRGSPKRMFLALPEVCEKMGASVLGFEFENKNVNLLEATIFFESNSETKQHFLEHLKKIKVSYFNIETPIEKVLTKNQPCTEESNEPQELIESDEQDLSEPEYFASFTRDD